MSENYLVLGITSKPLTIQRTAASNWVRLYEDTVTLTCESGYQFASGRTELVLMVLADGDWNDTDSCEREYGSVLTINPLNELQTLQ